MPHALGSRHVEDFLAAFHDIAPGHRSAYAGRLKHLTRQGFPPGVAGGKGNPAQYDADQFFKMVVVMELAQFGVSPSRAMRLVEEAWPRLRDSVLEVWRLRTRGVDVPSIFWRVPVEALRHMAVPGRAYSPDASDTLDVMDAQAAEAAMLERGYNRRRRSFIVADQLIGDVFTQLQNATLGSPDRLASFMESMAAPAESVESC